MKKLLLLCILFMDISAYAMDKLQEQKLHAVVRLQAGKNRLLKKFEFGFSPIEFKPITMVVNPYDKNQAIILGAASKATSCDALLLDITTGAQKKITNVIGARKDTDDKRLQHYMEVIDKHTVLTVYKYIKKWNIATGECIQTMTPNCAIDGFALNPKNSYEAVSSYSDLKGFGLQVYDLQKGAHALYPLNINMVAGPVAYHPEQKNIVCCLAYDGSGMVLFDLATKKKQGIIELQLPSPCRFLLFNPVKNNMFITGQQDIDGSPAYEVDSISKKKQELPFWFTYFDYDKESQLMVSCEGFNLGSMVWDPKTEKEILRLPTMESEEHVKFVDSTKVLSVNTYYNYACLWDVAS